MDLNWGGVLVREGEEYIMVPKFGGRMVSEKYTVLGQQRLPKGNARPRGRNPWARSTYF